MIPSVVTGVEGVEAELSLVLVIPSIVTGAEGVEAGLSLVLVIPSVEGAESTCVELGGGVTSTSGGEESLVPVEREESPVPVEGEESLVPVEGRSH